MKLKQTGQWWRLSQRLWWLFRSTSAVRQENGEASDF